MKEGTVSPHGLGGPPQKTVLFSQTERGSSISCQPFCGSCQIGSRQFGCFLGA